MDGVLLDWLAYFIWVRNEPNNNQQLALKQSQPRGQVFRQILPQGSCYYEDAWLSQRPRFLLGHHAENAD